MGDCVKVFVLIGLVVIFIIIVYSVGTFRLRNETKASGEYLEVKFNDSFIRLPLYFKQGYYKTQFKLSDRHGYQRQFQAIPDTGSSYLIISGKDCKDCILEDGVWDAGKGIRRSLEPVQIKYAGGQVTTFYPWQAYLVDPIDLGYINTDIKVPNQEVRREDFTQNIGIDEVDYRIAEFGLVTQSDNQRQRPQNIMGLSPARDHSKERSFIASLGVPQRVLFDFPHHQLIIGETTDSNTPYGKGEMKTINLHQNQSLQYPFGKIGGIVLDNGTQVKGYPNYAIFDTGTNYTVVSQNFYNNLLRANEGDIPSRINFFFEGPQGSTKVSLDISYLQVGKVPIANTMIIGAKAFDQYSVEFNYDTHQINFISESYLSSD